MSAVFGLCLLSLDSVIFGVHWSTCSPDMTSFDCSQPLVLDTICHLGLQKDSTLVIPSYPQISRRPKIIHIYYIKYSASCTI